MMLNLTTAFKTFKLRSISFPLLVFHVLGARRYLTLFFTYLFVEILRVYLY